MKKVLCATSNQWKADLYRYLFDTVGLKMVSLADLPGENNDRPIENGDSVIENAMIKARHYWSTEHPLVFADDTGLEITALNGEPGVKMGRWGGLFDDDIDERIWVGYLLGRLDGVPFEKRTACLIDAWALIDAEGREYTREIRANFKIAEEIVSPVVPGSPITSVAVGLPESRDELLEVARQKFHQWNHIWNSIKGGNDEHR